MGDSKNVRADDHQAQLRKLQEEVASLRDQLRRSQRLAAVGTMAAMVAHEFNNILTPIISYAQLAQSNPSLSDKAIARAADGGQRATHICNAILGLTAQAPAAPVRVVLAELIRETLAAMARDPKRDAIDLSVRVPEDMEITVRRVELQQVLLNLLLNARAAVLAKPTPRRIAVSAETDQRDVFIQVADNGVGIRPEDLRKIFLPFFTTKGSGSGPSKGSGLGLAICHEIVSSMGGSISVRSTLDEGSTFTVRLPG